MQNYNNAPQQLYNIPRNYTFDMRVNVDFNTGYINFNVPNQPFVRKDSIPIIYTSQSQLPIVYPQNYIQSNNNQYNNLNKQQIIVYSRHPHDQNLQYSVSPSQSRIVYDEANTKGKISLNTTTFLAEQKLQPLQCVICQKYVSQQNFALHLQEHKNRKRTQNMKNQNKQQISPEVSIRNHNPNIEYIENIKNGQSLTSIHPSIEQIELNFSNSNPSILSQRSHCLNPPSQSHQTVFFPFQNSQMHEQSSYNKINQKNSLSLSRSSNQTQNLIPIHNPSKNHVNNLAKIQNQQSHLYYVNPNVSNFTLMGGVNHDKSKNNEALILENRQSFNNIQFNKIESMIIRSQQSNQQFQGLDNIKQSVISRNSVQSQTAFSQIQHMNNQLRSHSHNNSMDSSDSDDSLLVNPSTIYQSVTRSVGIPSKQSIGQTIKKKIHKSTYTQKPVKSKIPVNFLAVQDFLTNSTSSSFYRQKSLK